MSERPKTITENQLTDALSDYFIERNMGMPGPRQERMAADIWFRLPADPPASETVEAAREALLGSDWVGPYGAHHAFRQFLDAFEAAIRVDDGVPADPPASETVEAAWRGLIEAIDRPHAVTTVAFYRPRIEAAIRADETRDCQSRADNEYERGRAAALDEAIKAIEAVAENPMNSYTWGDLEGALVAIDKLLKAKR